MKNQKGFGALGLILIVVAIMAIAGTAVFVANRNSDNNSQQDQKLETTLGKTNLETDMFTIEIPEDHHYIECEEDGFSGFRVSSLEATVRDCESDKHETSFEKTDYTIICGDANELDRPRLTSEEQLSYNGALFFDLNQASANDGRTRRILHNLTIQEGNTVCALSVNYRSPISEFNEANLVFSKGLFPEFDQIVKSFLFK